MADSEERRTEEAFRVLQEAVSSGAKPGDLAGRSRQLIELAQSAVNGGGRNVRLRLKRARDNGPAAFADKLDEVVGEIAHARMLADFQQATEAYNNLRASTALWLQNPASHREFFRERRQTVLEMARTAKDLPGTGELICRLEHARDATAFVAGVRRLLKHLWKQTEAGVPSKESFRSSYPHPHHEQSLSA
jgi:hypothetical protein